MCHVILTTPTWGTVTVVIERLTLHVANSCTKFEAAVAVIFQGVYNSKMCHVIMTTPLSRQTTSAGWVLLPLTYRPNLKFLTKPIMKI